MTTPFKGAPTIPVNIMNLQLKDKTALVSGSSQGIGFAIAEALAAEGATVVINSKTVRPTSIIKRFIRPQEVASLVTYLCSPLASATNGAALRVDGGVVASSLSYDSDHSSI